MAERLILDFDGVIVNSLREVAITAYNSVAGTAVCSFEALPEAYLQRFLENRYLVQPAGDFIPFAAWCLSAAEEGFSARLSRSELAKLLAAETRPLKERTRSFFAARRKFHAADRSAWLSLHEVYEPLCTALRNGAAGIPLILTNKNREAVVSLLTHFELPFRDDYLYSGDGGATKHENFNKILRNHPADCYHFVDDSLGNLVELQNELGGRLSFVPRLALWGYVGPDDASKAAAHGINSIGQEELIALAEQFGAGR